MAPEHALSARERLDAVRASLAQFLDNGIVPTGRRAASVPHAAVSHRLVLEHRSFWHERRSQDCITPLRNGDVCAHLLLCALAPTKRKTHTLPHRFVSPSLLPDGVAPLPRQCGYVFRHSLFCHADHLREG